MRSLILLAAIGLAATACAETDQPQAADQPQAPDQAQAADRLNPVIPLLEQGLPVLGVVHPPYTAGRGGSEAPDLEAAARELVEYQLGDFVLNSYSPRSADRYRAFMRAIVEAGGSARTHPFLAKIPIVHRDPEEATRRLTDQLNDGQVAVAMQEVETVEEVEQVIAAMRFTSKGGVRPEEGFERAAAYWDMTEAEYLEKADVWPLNPDGELLLTVIIESPEGVANAREISAVPGVSVVIVGAGTLGGVFTSRNAEGERVRDQEGFDAAVATVLAACKEFGKSCGYPANDPAEVEALMADGWDFFIMQRRNQDAFDAVLTGRRLAGRPLQGS